jgi:hypothetical protein
MRKKQTRGCSLKDQTKLGRSELCRLLPVASTGSYFVEVQAPNKALRVTKSGLDSGSYIGDRKEMLEYICLAYCQRWSRYYIHDSYVNCRESPLDNIATQYTAYLTYDGLV